MRAMRFAIVFVMGLSVGLSLALPAEDLPDTVFDESETFPYLGTPAFRIVVPV